MEVRVVTDETTTAWQCPKDGAPMQPMGRRGRGGAWRCPTCRGLFIDTEAMRRGRPPKWSPVVTSVVMSLLARAVVRRMRRRSAKRVSS
jgi:Transcription factor zinc-finger